MLERRVIIPLLNVFQVRSSETTDVLATKSPTNSCQQYINRFEMLPFLSNPSLLLKNPVLIFRISLFSAVNSPPGNQASINQTSSSVGFVP